MIILTSYTSATYKAQIRSSKEHGFKPLYNATCTMGEELAAKAVVEKHFGTAAADTVRRASNEECRECGFTDWMKSPLRKQIFTAWTFNPRAGGRTAR